MAAALPVIDLVYRRGRFGLADAHETALYFFWFSLSLALWSAQSLYARAFYAAGDTLTPMIAATLLTLASLPIYSALFHKFSTAGLAVASDFGILANTVGLAILLHRKKLVPFADLRWMELGKAAVTAVVAGFLSYRVSLAIPVQGRRMADILGLLVVTLTWAAAVLIGLWLLRSDLPNDLRRRKPTAYPRVAERQAEETSAGIEP